MERTSLKFKHMSKNTLKLIFAMLLNQNLVRYIHYLGDYNPLDSNLPNVNYVEVKDSSFVMTKFNPEILKETKTMIFFNPQRGRFTGQVTAGDMYQMDIIIPYTYWVIKNTSELRAYSIAHEVAQVIDQKNVAGIGNVEITGWESYKVDDTFSGLTLYMEVTNATYKR